MELTAPIKAKVANCFIFSFIIKLNMKQFATLALIGAVSSIQFTHFNPLHDNDFVVL
jgi:hypothetical protein